MCGQPDVPCHPWHQCAAPADCWWCEYSPCGSQCTICSGQPHLWHQPGECVTALLPFKLPCVQEVQQLKLCKGLRIHAGPCATTSLLKSPLRVLGLGPSDIYDHAGFLWCVHCSFMCHDKRNIPGSDIHILSCIKASKSPCNPAIQCLLVIAKRCAVCTDSHDVCSVSVAPLCGWRPGGAVIWGWGACDGWGHRKGGPHAHNHPDRCISASHHTQQGSHHAMSADYSVVFPALQIF